MEPTYPLVFSGALCVKIRDEGAVRDKAVHIALGVRADGAEEILGLWLEQNEGAKFWLRVMNGLRNRGVEDILMAVVDGLKGLADAITAVFAGAMVRTCIVHLLRKSLDFVSCKDRKSVATASKDITRAVNAVAGGKALTAFEASGWGRKYPAIGQSRGRAWPEVIPFFAFQGEVRRIVHTGERDRGFDRKAAPRRPRQGPFPQRRSRDKAPVSGLESQREGVDHAAKSMVHGQGSGPCHLRRALHQGDGLNMFSNPP